MAGRKNEAMYASYGKDYTHQCGECANLYSHNCQYFKCQRYGGGYSAATDWRKKWTACGKFNIPLNPGEKPMIRRLPPAGKEIEQVPGQISLFEQTKDPA